MEVLIVKMRQYIQLYENAFSEVKLDMYLTSGSHTSARIMFKGTAIETDGTSAGPALERVQRVHASTDF